MAGPIPPAGPPPGAPGALAPGSAMVPAPPTALAGPTGVDPQLSALRKSLTPLDMKNEEVADWKKRIEASIKRVTEREEEWDDLFEEYDPNVSDGAQAADLKANTHFRNIHTKTGQLFVRSPHILMSPKGPALDSQIMPGPPGPDGMPGPPVTYSPQDAVATRQAVLNYYMGPEEIDGLALMDECLFDMQGYSGIACVQVGYRNVSRPVQQPVMGPDPNHVSNPMSITPTPPPQVPQMDPLTGQPKTQTVMVPIFEQWYAEKFSTKKILFDELLRSPRYWQRSRWIGRRNTISKRLAKKLWGLTDEDCGNGGDGDDRVYEYAEDKGSDLAVKDQIWYSEIWLKAIYFDDKANGHPEQLYHLIFCDPVNDRPIVYEPWKDQTFDEQGQLTPDSVREWPIKIGSLRTTLDSPFPKSDAAFTQAIIKQINTFLQQSVLLRDAAIGKYFYDTEAIDGMDLDKIKAGPVGGFIGLKGGAMLQGADKIFFTTAQVHSSPDDWRTLQMLKSFLDETLGISATQAGATTDTVRSATEINAVGASSSGRQEKERSNAVAFYLSIARCVDQYLFRYAQGNRWVSIVGKDGAQKLQMWNKTLGSGCYSYDIEPDSQLQIDAARERQLKTSAYNVLAPDPLFRRVVAIRDICRLNGWDPADATVDEATANAQAAQAQAGGPPIGQPPHPGGPVNKHVQEKSGATQNHPSPAGPGDNRQERNPPPAGQMARPTP